MTDDEPKINILVLSAENEFQIKLLNSNLESISAQLQQLNGNIRNWEQSQDKQIDTLHQKLKEINKNIYELVYHFVNFHR